MSTESMANAELAAPGTSLLSRVLKRAAITLLVLLVLAGAAAGAVTYVTNDFEDRYRGRLLPETSVAGVDISGMTPPQALSRVREAIEPRLTRKIVVSWNGRKWRTTPRELGARSNARAMVAAAKRASKQPTFMDLARMRLLGEELDFERTVAFTYPERGARRFIEGIAAKVDEQPVNASIDYSTGWVRIADSSTGRKVEVDKAHAQVMRTLRRGEGPSRLRLPVAVLQPEVTEAAYDEVLLVRIGENKLYLYQDNKITHSWTVATGQPEYMTPTGVYEVTEKRYMPTWINPAPTTWGADMPAEIGPGRDNPLGIRALNWSASGIRFHGTEATYSLGYNASHGCVRLSNDEVVQLYNLVDVGTPIVSVVAGELKPQYSSSSNDPIPVAGSN